MELTRDELIGRITPGVTGRASGDREDASEVFAIGSPTTAHARVRKRAANTRYTDDLTLVRIDGCRRIVAKAWHEAPFS